VSTGSTRWYVAGYWPSRSDGQAECTQSVITYLTELGRVDGRLATWFQGADTVQEARSNPIDVTAGSIESLLLSGRSRLDSDGSVIADLGFGLSGWNGALSSDDQARFSIRCSVTSTRVPNSVLVDVPGSIAAEGDACETTRRLVATTAAVWRPDWATCCTDRLRKDQGAKAAGRIVVGQHTYIAARRGTPPDLPEPFTTTPVDDIGTIISIVGVEATADLIGELVASLDRSYVAVRL